MSDDLMDDGEEGAAVETPKSKKKAGKKKAAVKAAKPVKAKAPAGTTGRPASPETTERRKRILQMAKRKDGVSNIELAEDLEIKTAASQSLARPMVAQGLLKMVKDKESGRVVYKAT